MTLDAAQQWHAGGVLDDRSVLVVETDRRQAAEIGRWLEAEGFQVHIAFDEPGAVALCHRFEPVLMFVDAGLAAADGSGLMARLGTLRPDTPLVLTTAKTDIRSAAFALVEGASDCLLKPLKREDLRALLGRRAELSPARPTASAHGIGAIRRQPVTSASVVDGSRRRAEIPLDPRTPDSPFDSEPERATLGYFVRDLTAERCVHCSDDYLRILGAPLEDCIANPVQSRGYAQWVHPDDRERYLASAEQAARSRQPIDIEYRILRADGEVRQVREREHFVDCAAGVPLRSHGTLQDITALRRIVDDARNRDLWLRAILANSPTEIAIKDREGRVLAVSRNTLEDHGLKEEDVIGRRSEDLLPAELIDAYVAADRHVVESGEVLQQEITEIRDGRPVHFLSAKFPLTDDAGQIIGVCSLTSNITPVKEVQARLNQSQKLEAVGQLTGGVAHDFNNLLAVILGNLELAAEQLGPGHPCLDEIERALRAGRRGAELISRLLSFSRRQAMEPKQLDISATVADMTDLLERTLGSRIELEVRAPESAWGCTLDAVQLETAVLNLAINARDAMPEGGRLTIEVANLSLDDPPATTGCDLAPGDYVMLSVSDTGTGMPPELIDRVFEPFFTTKGPDKGSGLGLSMVFGFAKQSGGYAAIESREGEGTTVRLYLPRWRGASSPCAPFDASALPGDGGKAGTSAPTAQPEKARSAG